MLCYRYFRAHILFGLQVPSQNHSLALKFLDEHLILNYSFLFCLWEIILCDLNLIGYHLSTREDVLTSTYFLLYLEFGKLCPVKLHDVWPYRKYCNYNDVNKHVHKITFIVWRMEIQVYYDGVLTLFLTSSSAPPPKSIISFNSCMTYAQRAVISIRMYFHHLLFKYHFILITFLFCCKIYRVHNGR